MTTTTTNFSHLAQSLATLGNETRLSMLGYLKANPGASVEDLVAFLELPQSVVSRHLMALRRAGVVAFDERGSSAFKTHRYSLKSEIIQDDAEALAALAS
ncbi:MAG: helix-turn-helix transcriptional regulator [Chloroflexi bacterium]|nr:helix-turn-helix transcriptional regulator [Chloroflexota bacterium]